MQGIEAGDWRAADALLTRVHGRPTERLELEDKRLEDLELGDLDACWPGC